VHVVVFLGVVVAAAIEANISDFSMSFESYWNINYIARRTHAKSRKVRPPFSDPRKTPRGKHNHSNSTTPFCVCACVSVCVCVCLAIKLHFFPPPLVNVFRFLFGVTRASRKFSLLFICRTHTANVYLNLYRMRNRIFHPRAMLHNKFNGFLDKSQATI